MNKNSEIQIVIKKPPKPSSKKLPDRKKLPRVSHNKSVAQLKFEPYQKLLVFNPNKIFLSKKQNFSQQDSLIDKKIKFNYSMEQEYDKLDFLSQRNFNIRSDYLVLQQKLIQIASYSKLPSIKETKNEVETKKKINSHFDSIFDKYLMNTKPRLKSLDSSMY